MSSINRIDQAALLLREQIRRLSRQTGQGAASASACAATQTAHSLSSLKELKRRGEVDEHLIRKALVQALLAESMGLEVTTSAGFQAMADKVQTLIEQDMECLELVSSVLAEIA